MQIHFLGASHHFLAIRRNLYSYFREHNSLGKTPAEAANIEIEGRNKWITVIQNATRIEN